MALTVAREFAAPKVYRLAVFGPRAAGKTTVLAALGLGIGRHSPAGYACVRQRYLPKTSSPPGDELADPRACRTDPVKAFYRGNDRLKRAEDNIRALKPAEPTSINEPPLLLVYQMTVPGHGLVTFEACEFAGEFLNGDRSAPDNARALEENLARVDAIVVLAEATHPGAPPEVLAAELLLLQEAFLNWSRTRTAGTHLKVPVAMLFNKWDRRGKPDATAEDRAREIEQFLEESPAHRTLVAALEAVTERFERFAGSAFGCHRADVDAAGRPILNTDRPAAYPLPSFGLEDPFVWAVGQTDDRERQAIVKKAAGLRWRRPLGTFPWDTCWIWRLARRLARRLPADSGAAREVTAAGSRAARQFGWQMFLGLAAIIIVALIVEATADEFQRDRALSRLQDPNATSADFDRAGQWLDDYASSTWLRHRVTKLYFPATKAAEVRRNELWRRDDRAWDVIASVSGPAERLALLDQYLVQFPNGRHADDARALRETTVAQIRRAADRDQLAAVGREFPSVRNNKAELARLYDRFRQLPGHPMAETDEDRAAREALGLEMARAYARLVEGEELAAARREWARVKGDVDGRLAQLEFGKAVRGLAAFAYPLPEAQEARAGFGKDAATAADLVADRAVKARTWDEPIGKLTRALDDSEVLRATGREASAGISGTLRRLRLDRDRHYYREFVDAVSDKARAAAAADYLKLPGPAMHADVSRWVEWHDRMDQPTELEFEVEFEWADWDERHGVRIVLEINNRAVIDELKPSAPGGKTGAIHSAKVTLKPQDTCSVHVTLRTEDKWIWVGDRHTADFVKDDYTPAAWHLQSVVVNNNLDTRMWVAVRGLPERPAPKSWSEAGR